MRLSVLLLASLLAHHSAVAEEQFPSVVGEYPIDAALSKSADGNWIFRSFPEGSQLYIYKKDEPEKSNCNKGCAAAWPPLLVSSDKAKTVGNWTILTREDGRKQWVYKGQPVYRRYHDFPTPTNRYEKYGFYLLIP